MWNKCLHWTQEWKYCIKHVSNCLHVEKEAFKLSIYLTYAVSSFLCVSEWERHSIDFHLESTAAGKQKQRERERGRERERERTRGTEGISWFMWTCWWLHERAKALINWTYVTPEKWGIRLNFISKPDEANGFASFRLLSRKSAQVLQNARVKRAEAQGEREVKSGWKDEWKVNALLTEEESTRGERKK